ncbi:MAG: hypothetical protein ACLPT4_15915 [Verrucomicrobiia bacterium]
MGTWALGSTAVLWGPVGPGPPGPGWRLTVSLALYWAQREQSTEM